MAKKTILLILFAGLMFTACNKDNEEASSQVYTSGNNSAKHLAKITVINDHGYNTMSYRFDWDEDQLRHIYISEEGYLNYEVTIDYSGNTINRCFVYDYDEQSGKMLDFNYTSGQLTSITSPNFDGIIFQYLGNKLSEIISSDTRLSLTWNDGNIGRLISYGDFDVRDIEYDNKYNPLNDIFSTIFPGWNASINNPTRMVSDNKVLNIMYEFSNGSPTIATITNSDGFAKLYYQYSDGSGVRPPTEDKLISRKGNKKSYIPLPNVFLH